MSRINRKTQKCYYCEGAHSCRECPQEKLISPIMKKLVGMYMEHIVANKIKCPKCFHGQLNIIGTHAPSLDIICEECKTKFEIKSKCISAKTIPDDLILDHGNYFDYLNRQNSVNGLDFIIIIYGVNRNTKVITIRKVLHVPSNMTRNPALFTVVKKNNSSHSNIFIPNYNKLNEIKLNESVSYDFSHNIKEILNSPYDHTVPIILA